MLGSPAANFKNFATHKIVDLETSRFPRMFICVAADASARVMVMADMREPDRRAEF